MNGFDNMLPHVQRTTDSFSNCQFPFLNRVIGWRKMLDARLSASWPRYTPKLTYSHTLTLTYFPTCINICAKSLLKYFRYISFNSSFDLISFIMIEFNNHECILRLFSCRPFYFLIFLPQRRPLVEWNLMKLYATFHATINITFSEAEYRFLLFYFAHQLLPLL